MPLMWLRLLVDRHLLRRDCLMKREETPITTAAFTGQWIGETQGCEMPAHLWEITQQGSYLLLKTRWEGESTSGHFLANIVPGEAAFLIPGNRYEREHKALLIDKQHFVIPDWCTGTKKGWDGVSPTYDVIFSRPGIGELTAQSAYLKNLEQRKAANSQDAPSRQTEIDPTEDHRE
jgi:hypothetical protein